MVTGNQASVVWQLWHELLLAMWIVGLPVAPVWQLAQAVPVTAAWLKVAAAPVGVVAALTAVAAVVAVVTAAVPAAARAVVPLFGDVTTVVVEPVLVVVGARVREPSNANLSRAV